MFALNQPVGYPSKMHNWLQKLSHTRQDSTKTHNIKSCFPSFAFPLALQTSPFGSHCFDQSLLLELLTQLNECCKYFLSQQNVLLRNKTCYSEPRFSNPLEHYSIQHPFAHSFQQHGNLLHSQLSKILLTQKAIITMITIMSDAKVEKSNTLETANDPESYDKK